MKQDSIGLVGCPSEQSLVEFVEHVLDEARWEQVELHLDGCIRCQTAVAGLAIEDDDEPGSSEPGEVVYGDRYRVEDTLGAGAMGIVYAAHDRELDRRVALKVLQRRVGFEELGGTRSSGDATAADGARALERARREARALAQLNHPNVVEVFDVGPCDEGLFIAMELVAGTTLRKWLNERARTWPEILAVFLDAARALAAAHEAGIVHRDFKPDNMMVANGVTKVLDFGLARAEKEEDVTHGGSSLDVSERRLTRTGIVMGTPRYLAPELHRGALASGRSDQYAFFVSLYEAIGGRPPFPAGSMRGLILAKLEGVSMSSPPWPSVPSWLRAAIVRGTNPDPQARYADMREVVAALSASTGRRSRLPWVAGIAGAAAIVGFALGPRVGQGGCDEAEQRLAGVWDERERAEAASRLQASGSSAQPTLLALDDYVDRWTTAYAEACRLDDDGTVRDHDIACLLEARAALGELVGRLGVDEPLPDPTVLPDPSACSDARNRSGGEHDPEEQPLRDMVARGVVLANAQRADDALGLLLPTIEQAQARGSTWIEARARFAAGVVYSNDARYDDARRMLEAAYELARSEGHDAIEADAATWMAKMLAGHLAQPTEALSWVRHAEAALLRAELEPEQDHHLQVATGKALSATGDHELAIVHFERALASAEDASDRAVALLNLGTALGGLGRHAEAAKKLRRGVELLVVDQGPDSPRTLNAQLLVVAALVEGGDIAGAAVIIEEVVAVLDHAKRPYHTVEAQARQAQGAVYAMQERWAEAVAAFEAALRASTEIHGTNSDEVVICLINLARVHLMMKACDAALDYAVRAATTAEALAVEDPVRLEHANGIADQARACL